MLAALLVLCIAAAGCIFWPQQPPASQYTPTVSPSGMPATTAAPAYPATPGPVQTVPSFEAVSVTVDRNIVSTDPTITVTFDGGKGLGMTTRMDVTVIRSDGAVETGFRNKPQMGTSITQMGTTGSDRVIVTVTMTSGDQYTILDGYYPFPGSMVPP